MSLRDSVSRLILRLISTTQQVFNEKLIICLHLMYEMCGFVTIITTSLTEEVLVFVIW